MSEPHDDHHNHDFGLACDDCAGPVDDDKIALAWYRQPKIVLLAVAALLTAVGFLAAIVAPGWPATAVFLAAVLCGGYYPALAAWESLLNLTLTINSLLVAATAGAIALNLWGEAATLVVVFSLGGILETFAVDRARNSLEELIRLAPPTARVIRQGVENVVPVALVKMGEFILVKPGDQIPLDGTVSAGLSTVNQATITGESIPAFKKPGDGVYAGTVNLNGSLEVKVTARARDTTLAKIIHAVEEHQARKSSYQRFSERFGAIYTPALFGVALGVMLLPPLMGGPWRDWFYRGLVVLVVSCSCGIALSVPVAIVAAIARAARQGVLIKGGAYVELLGRIKIIVFDKTGTLTYGDPAVVDILTFGDFSENKVLEVAAAVERKSGHPLASAVITAAEARKLPKRRVLDFRALPGLGAYGRIGRNIYHVGNLKLITAHDIVTAEASLGAAALEAEGKSLVYVTENDQLVGLIAIADTVRETAAAALADLKRSGMQRLIMLTGDNVTTASAIAAQVGIDEYRADLLPEAKAAVVVALQEEFGRAAMVGDGINDTPALAAASVGVAMGAAGSGIAVETGDIVLMADDLSNLAFAVRLSRRTRRIIGFNIGAALTIVLVLVTLALLGRVQLVPGLFINEMGAFLIILNSVRLLR